MHMRRTFLHCFVIALIAFFATTTGFAGELKPGEKRILIITGEDGPVHYWPASTKFLKRQLEQDSRLHVDVLDDLTKLAATDFSSYGAVVLHFKNFDPEIPGRTAFDALSRYVHEGGGLVVLHWASAAFSEFSDAYKKLAGRVWGVSPKNSLDGVNLYEMKTAERKRLVKDLQQKGVVFSSHDPYDLFTVRITDHDHPITRGLKDFQTVDELYYNLIGDAPIEILAEATSQVNGKVYPMAFTLTPGKGRVFHSPLGHAQSVNVPTTGQLLRRGTAWAAGLTPQ